MIRRINDGGLKQGRSIGNRKWLDSEYNLEAEPVELADELDAGGGESKESSMTPRTRTAIMWDGKNDQNRVVLEGVQF